MSETQLKTLLTAVNDVENLLIKPHNDPDPDAIASAIALQYLLGELLQIKAKIVYHGIIGRAENKALISYLGHPLTPRPTLTQLRAASIALVDTQPSNRNITLPNDATISLVIDHHPWREETASVAFADVRAEIGSTSTLLTEYLQAANLTLTPQVATALFYGIKTDTRGLSRSTSPADVAAYFYLQPQIDIDALAEIEQAQLPLDYFKVFNKALRAARIFGHVIIAFIDTMTYPDMAAEIADMLLRARGCEWVICFGAYRNDLRLAIRTRQKQGHAGELAQTIVADQGVAGGHEAMAGGQIPLENRNPKHLATRIGKHALSALHINPDITAERLV